MKRGLVTILMLTALTSGYAQRLMLPIWTTIDSGSTAGVYGYGSFASNSISNRFARELTRGDFLVREDRLDQFGQLSTNRNRLGGGYALGVQARVAPFQDSSLALTVSFTDEAFAELVFTPDAFGLTFLGNEPFKGDTLNLGTNYLRAGRFQKFGFGFTRRVASGMEFGAMLSFINGEAGVYANVPEASLYTSNLGDTLASTVVANAFLSDTSNNGFMRHNGAGAMIDFFIEQQFTLADRLWEVQIGMMNLGIVQWQPSTQHYRIDSTVQWTGIRIDDALNIEQQVNAVDLQDSVDVLLNSGGFRGPANQVLPGWMQLQIDQVADKGFRGGLGMAIRPESFALPYGYILPGYQFNPQLGMELELGLGGYGSFQMGWAGTYHNEQWRVQIRASNLEAIFAPGTFGGLTLAGSIQYLFDL